MGPGAGLADLLGNASPDQKKEQMKREEEQKRWEQQTAAFREYYNRQAVYKSDRWDLLTDSANKDEENDDGARLVAGDETLKKPPEHGIYAYNHGNPGDKDYRSDFNISYDEQGVCPIPHKLGKFDTEGWSAAMDFIAGKLGSDTVKLTVPAQPASPKMAKRNLIGMMSMAAEKGLAVEFDKSTTAFIKTLPVKDQIRLLAYKKALNNNHERTKMALGISDKGTMNKAREEVDAQHNTSKLEGADPASKTANLRAKIYQGVDTTDPDKKTEAVAKQINQLEQRLEVAQRALDRLVQGKEAQEKLIQNPEVAVRGSQRALKSNAYYSTVNKGFKKRAKALDSSPDGKLEVLDSVEKTSEMSKQERKQLHDTLQKELQDIKTQKMILEKELTDAKAAMPNPPTEAQSKQIEKMEAQVKRLGELETKGNAQLKNLSSVKKWDDTERKEKIAEKREQIAAAKKATAKPT
ncbi:hypothetical protein AQUSIP_04920 [Aquicella siphonis]|uniref:Uncharacterized protein n=1 Tax=Aquicella siphonis TaxID=254247 RepID=A0A5E4PF14_9COXI|nr:hypothetical protein [Aquicella siphonis]VVC75205.1 hypothetical protein AQUSIP_04920 [Aquicella siphonis]